MSRFPWGIRPPGAPTSIRPPSTPSTDGPLSSDLLTGEDQGRSMQLLSASDGWVIIDPDSSTASTFSKNGAPPLARSFRIPGN